MKPRVFQQAFHVMRSGQPRPVLIDLPFGVQMAEVRFDAETYGSLPVYKPRAALEQLVEIAAERQRAGGLKDRAAWVEQCRERKRTMLRRTQFDEVPIKPQRATRR